MKTNRRRFLASMFGGVAAVVAAPAVALVPAVVNDTPVDAAPVFNEMMRKLSETGGGILKAVARTYHMYSPLRLQSHVTLDVSGAEIMMHDENGLYIEVAHNVKHASLFGGNFVCFPLDSKWKEWDGTGLVGIK